MHTALQKIIVSAVIIMLTVDNFTSVIITGETEVNGTYGSNINIIWKVNSTTGEHQVFEIFVNKTSNETQLLALILTTPVASANFSKGQSRNDVAQRSHAVYYPTGNSGGIVEGEVALTIRNLQLNDSNEYILQDNNQKKKMVLSVNFGPEKCGSDFASEYMVNHGENLLVTAGSCGKPQPIVTCKFDGRTYTSVNVTEVNPYNYTYTFVIPTNLEPCDRVKLSCTAIGHGESATEYTNAVGNFTEEKRIAGGVCAGYIVGFEVGVILLCVFIYLYLVVWGATKEAGKLAGFIIALIAGAGLIIGFAVAYGALRKTSESDDCNENPIRLKKCDNAFIAMGVIDFIGFLVLTLASVKLLKDFRTKPSDQAPESEKKTLLTEHANNSSNGKNVEEEDSPSKDEESRTEL